MSNIHNCVILNKKFTIIQLIILFSDLIIIFNTKKRLSTK